MGFCGIGRGVILYACQDAGSPPPEHPNAILQESIGRAGFPPVDESELIAAWKETINGPEKSWVLFRNGTCVILMKPAADLAAQAKTLLREFGPVHSGSTFGDFSTIELNNGRGWVVTSHHPDILTLVGPDEARDGCRGSAARGRPARKLSALYPVLCIPAAMPGKLNSIAPPPSHADQ